MKREYIAKEIWLLTTNAAFQRAKVYSGLGTAKERKTFKAALKRHLDPLLAAQYRKTASLPMADPIHVQNIRSIQDFSRDYGRLLQDEMLNFGVSQKLLNLYLKYQWCLGWIPEPPHFPVDRRIQQVLVNPNEIENWTEMNSEAPYMKIIGIARRRLTEDKFRKYNSLAKLELHEFSRS